MFVNSLMISMQGIYYIISINKPHYNTVILYELMRKIEL